MCKHICKYFRISTNNKAMYIIDTITCKNNMGCCGVLVTATAQLHSTIPELRFCAGSNPARGMSETCDGEDI